MKYVVYIGVDELPAKKAEEFTLKSREAFKDFFDSWDKVVYLPRRSRDSEIVMLPSEVNPDADRCRPNTVPRDLINDVIGS